MIDTKKLFLSINRHSNFFVGVPDSVLKNFLNHLENRKDIKNVIATNEGSAISLGIGYHLSTKKIPCVYLQNSGLGNSVNPLVSIAHSKIYSIPLLLLIGWRGTPNLPDEPQHIIKGKITKDILKILNIEYLVLNNNNDLKKIKQLILSSQKKNKPVAILVKKDTLNKVIKKNRKKIKGKNLKRELFIKKLLSNVKKKDKIVSTTGYTSRELHQIRKNYKITNGQDFYMVGGMGHSLSVAQGISLFSKSNIICLDGDGSILMHLGSMHMSGLMKKKNLKHVILNNGSHESVGGQRTFSEKINFKQLSTSLGYKNFFCISSKINIDNKIQSFLSSKGPSLLEVKIFEGSLENLKRPSNFIEIKKNFIK